MRVVMVGRDRHRTEAARRFVINGSGFDRVTIALADFSSLDQVRRLADEILAANSRLDLLVTFPRKSGHRVMRLLPLPAVG
jgi:NAD(P)-dependent dehydrogenase (short-subunit alcohol dehydrogenase family)